MANSEGSKGQLTVILVAYHIHDAEAAFALIEDFCQQIGKSCLRAVVVDNSGAMTPYEDNQGKWSVIRGDNSSWEFSGWLRGIDEFCGTGSPVVALLNDSYGRNWTLSSLSKAYMHRMYLAACNARVAVWMDNFSLFNTPRLSRRPNSRIVFVSISILYSLNFSLNQSIETLRELTAEGKPLFTSAEKACLERWMTSQPGRWEAHTLQNRIQRIFLEHHMFDALEPGLLKCFPATLFGSLAYAVVRRLFRETR